MSFNPQWDRRDNQRRIYELTEAGAHSREWKSSVYAEGVGDGATAFEVVFTVPDDGRRTIISPTFAQRADGLVTFARDVTIDTAGTELTTIPKRVSQTTDPSVNAETGGDYTVNGESIQSLLPREQVTAGVLASPTTSAGIDASIEIAPGDSVLFRVFNNNGGPGKYSAAFSIKEPFPEYQGTALEDPFLE